LLFAHYRSHAALRDAVALCFGPKSALLKVIGEPFDLASILPADTTSTTEQPEIDLPF
jgi:hypothetical protein